MSLSSYVIGPVACPMRRGRAACTSSLLLCRNVRDWLPRQAVFVGLHLVSNVLYDWLVPRAVPSQSVPGKRLDFLCPLTSKSAFGFENLVLFSRMCGRAPCVCAGRRPVN